MGIPVFLKKVELEGKGAWYRVYVGPYPTKDQADLEGEKGNRGAGRFSEAIMTTDLKPKQVAVRAHLAGKMVTVGGMMSS